MGAAREMDQADFDLERFIDMFDEAMMSNDPRVVETLRRLMMIVALTAPETRNEHVRRSGPLRRLFEDMNHLNNRLHRMEEDLHRVASAQRREWPKEEAYEKFEWNAAAQNLRAQSIDDTILKQIAKNTAPAGLYHEGQIKK